MNRDEVACWREIADAIVEHDVEHERRALAELALVVQRTTDALVNQPAQGQRD